MSQPTHARRPMVEAPAWTLEMLDSGTVSFPAVLEGRPAVIFLWATWCPYCHRMMPRIQAIKTEYADIGLEVYAVNVWQDDGDRPVDEVIRSKDVDFIVLLDGDEVADAYGLQGTPGLYIVDGDGFLVWERGSVLGDQHEELSHRQKARIAAPIWERQMQAVLAQIRAETE